MPNCIVCNKKLVSFGDKRKNGKAFRHDFDNRQIHLKCWKERMKDKAERERINQILATLEKYDE